MSLYWRRSVFHLSILDVETDYVVWECFLHDNLLLALSYGFDEGGEHVCLIYSYLSSVSSYFFQGYDMDVLLQGWHYVFCFFGLSEPEGWSL